MSLLKLREPTIEDQDNFLFSIKNSKQLHFPWVTPPQTAEEFQNYLKRSKLANHRCLLVCNNSDNIIGIFNISEIVLGSFQSAYLGFYAMADYAGEGLMSQGLKLVLEYIFKSLKLHRIEANIQPENKPSINLVKANGFSKEGYSPKYLNINGIWCDHERWALTYESWHTSVLE